MRYELTHTHAYVCVYECAIRIFVIRNVNRKFVYCSILLFALHHPVIVKHEIGAGEVLFNQTKAVDWTFVLVVVVLYQCLIVNGELNRWCMSFFRVDSRNHIQQRREGEA